VQKYGIAIQVTDDNTMRRMRLACWVSKATDMHSEYIIALVIAQQQRLREHASVLRL
jgi:hypothetical protein